MRLITAGVVLALGLFAVAFAEARADKPQPPVPWYRRVENDDERLTIDRQVASKPIVDPINELIKTVEQCCAHGFYS